jgi:hypothetical protein
MRSIVVCCVLGLFSILSTHAIAADNPLLGSWEIVEASAAPWAAAKDRAALDARGRKLLHLQLTFKPKEVSAKHDTLGCKKATYEIGAFPPDALFQANLPEPKEKFAKALGFGTADIPSVDLKCSTGLLSYHFRDRDTALISLDDVIYTFKRR